MLKARMEVVVPAGSLKSSAILEVYYSIMRAGNPKSASFPFVLNENLVMLQ